MEVKEKKLHPALGWLVAGAAIVLALIAFIGWGVTCQRQPTETVRTVIKRIPATKSEDWTHSRKDNKIRITRPPLVTDTIVEVDSLTIRDARISYVHLGVGVVSMGYLDSDFLFHETVWEVPYAPFGFHAGLHRGVTDFMLYEWGEDVRKRKWRIELEAGGGIVTDFDSVHISPTVTAGGRLVLGSYRLSRSLALEIVPVEVQFNIPCGFSLQAKVRLVF